MRALHRLSLAAACVALVACGDSSTAPNVEESTSLTHFLPSHAGLRNKLRAILEEQNGGLGFDMWATILDRDARVVDVVFSGMNRGDQWPGSRVISAQKANTANAFSLLGFALSTGNLYAATQPGGSLFGLQESNPVDPEVAYGGKSSDYGTRMDPMIGRKIGGINVFGGGLALYTPSGKLIGGIGLSGDTACTDHIIAWKLRHKLNHAPGLGRALLYIEGRWGRLPIAGDLTTFGLSLNREFCHACLFARAVPHSAGHSWAPGPALWL